MTRTLRNEHVEIELADGTWTARWPAVGVTAGPFAARVDSPVSVLGESQGVGAWKVETTASGARARWTPTTRGVSVVIDVPTDDDVVVVHARYTPENVEQLQRIIPMSGPLGITPTRRLVEGYDSWAYAGVRATDAELMNSWWRASYVDSSGRAVAAAALGADRFCTRFASDDHASLWVDCGATPFETPAEWLGEATWGYEVSPSLDLDLPLTAGEEITSEAIALGAGADALALTEKLAAMVEPRRWPGPPMNGWESWYHYGLLIDTDTLLANARLLRERYAGRPGFDLVQLDDGWQVTYGAWWPNDRFPSDLTELTRELHEMGLRAGLWLAPFMVQPGAPGLGTDHEDWCIRHGDGATLLDRHDRWGLDGSHPEVLANLADLGAQVRAWGFDMVKLDFLYLGAQEGVRHDPRVTGTQALRAGLRAFVGELGDDVYVLGCGAPMLPMAGICHGNRVGHDLAIPVLLREFGQPLAEGWTGWAGIKAQARQVAARFALHRSWFDNDPDVVMAWGSDGRGGPDGYSLEESHTLAVLAALCGGPFLLADDLAALVPEERGVLEADEALDLAWGDGFRPLDLFEHVDAPSVEHAFAQPRDLASVWVAERAGRHVVALFNWTDEPDLRTAPEGSQVEIPPHGVRLLHA